MSNMQYVFNGRRFTHEDEIPALPLPTMNYDDADGDEDDDQPENVTSNGRVDEEGLPVLGLPRHDWTKER